MIAWKRLVNWNMPNRIIKESICVSEQIDELCWFDEVFFYRLLVNCDDYGCMDAREKVLAAKLFPLKAIRSQDIVKALDRLTELGLIGMYEADGRPYLKVLKWSEHQRVRISKHKYPEPTGEQLAAGCGNSRQVAANCGESRQAAADCGNLRPESNPIQSNPNTNPNTNPNPNTNTTCKHEEQVHTESLFNLFWEAYPRKEGKENARKQFAKLKPNDELMRTMLDAIGKQKESAQWKENGGQFIPYPASWLNGKRWEDEIRPINIAPTKQVAAQQYEQRDYGDEDDEAMQRQIEMIRRMNDGRTG